MSSIGNVGIAIVVVIIAVPLLRDLTARPSPDPSTQTSSNRLVSRAIVRTGRLEYPQPLQRVIVAARIIRSIAWSIGSIVVVIAIGTDTYGQCHDARVSEL